MTTKRLFKWLQVFVNKVQKIGNIEFYDEVDIPSRYKYVRATYKDYMLMLKYQNGFIFYEMRDRKNNEIMVSYYNTLNDFRKEFEL